MKNLIFLFFASLLLACVKTPDVDETNNMVSGVVYDSITKKPVAGIKIKLCKTRSTVIEGADIDYVDTTDNNGKFDFKFDFIDYKNYTYYIQAMPEYKYYTSGMRSGIIKVGKDNLINISIERSKNYIVINGFVMDSITKVKLSNIKLELMGINKVYNVESTTFANSKTDSTGQYILEGELSHFNTFNFVIKVLKDSIYNSNKYVPIKFGADTTVNIYLNK
jgi:hypothetical protein